MLFQLPKPITYLITSGGTTAATRPSDSEFRQLINLIEVAVAARVDLLQIREKNLDDRTLYELSVRASSITRGSSTHLLINDRADVARAAGADGVHLTHTSIETSVIRRTFGEQFLIGVSTHSIAEVEKAQSDSADFVVFGPVFETESKRKYGEPLGCSELQKAVTRVGTFPVLAIGGVTLRNAAGCFRAGASGIAAIRLFNDPTSIADVIAALRLSFEEAR